jgi:glycosyltransferase involved in cell wall biosynthesis
MGSSISRMSEPAVWHIIASEYPPQRGGVSDYTHVVAQALVAAGDEVHVWCPSPSTARAAPQVAGIVVHRELGAVGRSDLARLDQLLEPFPAPRRLLIQWVPHGFGFGAMNLWFCLWLLARARRRHDRIEIVVHEPFLRITGGSWRQSAAAVVQRLMTVVLLGGALRVLVTIPTWERLWRPYALGRPIPFFHAPVPSTVSMVHDTSRVQSIRATYATGSAPLIGHFGTQRHGGTVTIVRTLSAILNARPDIQLLLLGRGGLELREMLVGEGADPACAARVHATGALPAHELSLHLSACDVMVHPYASGVNGRHTSVVASLAHGRAVVTTVGELTEPFWLESGAVRVSRAGDAAEASRLAVELLSETEERERLGRAARALYDARFDVAHVVATLRSVG